ncbi:MAG: hypothetical protein FD123_222 [Bacteroidetes bacterium]|nr:MAG: hypothetical protein FD123_222 [Bacteroidota bacterium]
MNHTLIIITIGFVAGMLGGILGLGGAIVIIPALVMLLGYSQQAAQGTTLLMLTLPVGALAAWQYYKAGQVEIKTALILAGTFFIGGFFGAKLANLVPQEILKKGFAVLLVLIAVKMLFFEKTLK